MYVLSNDFTRQKESPINTEMGGLKISNISPNDNPLSLHSMSE